MRLFEMLKKSKGSYEDRREVEIALAQKEAKDEAISIIQAKTMRNIQTIATFLILIVFLVIGVMATEGMTRWFVVGAIALVFFVEIVEIFLWGRMKAAWEWRKEQKVRTPKKKKTRAKTTSQKATSSKKVKTKDIDDEIERIRRSLK